MTKEWVVLVISIKSKDFSKGDHLRHLEKKSFTMEWLSSKRLPIEAGIDFG
jgi:hypothetical protein